MAPFPADLHVHTGLSPCAESEMTPGNIIEACLARRIAVVGVADHNSGENARAVVERARGTGVTVWPGMEVQTREEVHLVVLFETLEALEEWQEFVYGWLPRRPNRPDVLGEQWIFDKEDRVIGTCARLLLASVDLSVEEVRVEAMRRKAVCYPAHVDRPAYSYLSNLGFLPSPGDFPAVEVSGRLPVAELERRIPDLAGRTVLVSSDAHRLREIVPPRMGLHLAEPTLDELRAAAAGVGGRRIEILA